MEIRKHVQTFLAIPGTLLLLGCVGCDVRFQRDDPINATVVDAVTAADSVSVFQVDQYPATSYDSGQMQKPGHGFLELLANSFYATDYRGRLDADDRLSLQRLLLTPRNYRSDRSLCIFMPDYGLRYCSAKDTMVVFVSTECAELRIIDGAGKILDGGFLTPPTHERLYQILTGF